MFDGGSVRQKEAKSKGEAYQLTQLKSWDNPASNDFIKGFIKGGGSHCIYSQGFEGNAIVAIVVREPKKGLITRRK